MHEITSPQIQSGFKRLRNVFGESDMSVTHPRDIPPQISGKYPEDRFIKKKEEEK